MCITGCNFKVNCQLVNDVTAEALSNYQKTNCILVGILPGVPTPKVFQLISVLSLIHNDKAVIIVPTTVFEYLQYFNYYLADSDIIPNDKFFIKTFINTNGQYSREALKELSEHFHRIYISELHELHELWSENYIFIFNLFIQVDIEGGHFKTEDIEVINDVIKNEMPNYFLLSNRGTNNTTIHHTGCSKVFRVTLHQYIINLVHHIYERISDYIFISRNIKYILNYYGECTITDKLLLRTISENIWYIPGFKRIIKNIMEADLANATRYLGRSIFLNDSIQVTSANLSGLNDDLTLNIAKEIISSIIKGYAFKTYILDTIATQGDPEVIVLNIPTNILNSWKYILSSTPSNAILAITSQPQKITCPDGKSELIDVYEVNFLSFNISTLDRLKKEVACKFNCMFNDTCIVTKTFEEATKVSQFVIEYFKKRPFILPF